MSNDMCIEESLSMLYFAMMTIFHSNFDVIEVSKIFARMTSADYEILLNKIRHWISKKGFREGILIFSEHIY